MRFSEQTLRWVKKFMQISEKGYAQVSMSLFGFAASAFPQSADVTISKQQLSKRDGLDEIRKPTEPTRDVTY